MVPSSTRSSKDRTTAKSEPRSQRIRVAERVADILCCLADDRLEMGVSEISKRLQLDKATVCRILLTLESRGFVSANPVTRKYSIGPKLLELAWARVGNANLIEKATPHMRWLRDQTGETVVLSIRSGFEHLYVQQIESRHEMRRTVQIGRTAPLYCGAPGKVILAHMSDGEMEHFFATVQLVPHTDKTVTDPFALRDALRQIRAQGFAVTIGERIPDTASIAVPVRDHRGDVAASLAISMPIMRYVPTRVDEWVSLVKSAAQRISAELGHLGQMSE